MFLISCQRDAMHSVFVFFFCVFTSGVYSAVFFEEQPEIPGHEGQCYDSDDGTFYNKGDIMKTKSEECIEKTCLGTDPETGKLGIEIFTCGTVATDPGFILIQDLSKPYPDCCPRAVAVSENQINSCDRKKQE